MIFLVDKDPISADSIAYYLEREGYEVRTIFDPESVVEEVRVVEPELVLLEIILAGTNGLVLTRRINEEPATAHVPLVVVSVIEAAERARDAGAQAFLSKPVDPERLVQTVRDLVDADKGARRA